MSELIFKDESYRIIGCCMEVYNNLGKGFLEIVYKDAIEYEFLKSNISYKREKEFEILYKNIILKHKFYADFIIFDKIVLEVKSSKNIIDEYVKQTLNYLSVTQYKLGLIVNFGENSFKIKRIVL
ncbi:MAG: GxxExxY protein [Bacteroidetes bacterium]|nr:GxxExxY protein [Bacteroidota bacterium]